MATQFDIKKIRDLAEPLAEGNEQFSTFFEKEEAEISDYAQLAYDSALYQGKRDSIGSADMSFYRNLAKDVTSRSKRFDTFLVEAADNGKGTELNLVLVLSMSPDPTDQDLLKKYIRSITK